jgi:opacity protein-like surface antigen
MRTKLLWAIVLIHIAAATALSQNVELTGYIGGQTNGGLDLSTISFERIDVQNGINYGLSAGYLLGEHGSIEFLWNYNNADTVAEPRGGGTSRKLFTLDTNQYFANFLFHSSPREQKLRPFVLAGLGATNLHAASSDVSSITRFAFALGAGAKYNFNRRLGVRLQAKWSPTYITTTSGGFWCDPVWGGCWVVGDNHFLNEFDVTTGLTLRF